MSESDGFIQIDPMSVDQLAGAVVLILGAIGSLLLVVWQSKCHCKVNLCYIFSCERRPPNEEEMKGLKNQAKKLKENKKKEDGSEAPQRDNIKKEDGILKSTESTETPKITKSISMVSLNDEGEKLVPSPKDKLDNLV
jgi:hypothetical protein